MGMVGGDHDLIRLNTEGLAPVGCCDLTANRTYKRRPRLHGVRGNEQHGLFLSSTLTVGDCGTGSKDAISVVNISVAVVIMQLCHDALPVDLVTGLGEQVRINLFIGYFFRILQEHCRSHICGMVEIAGHPGIQILAGIANIIGFGSCLYRRYRCCARGEHGDQQRQHANKCQETMLHSDDLLS